MWVGWKGDGGVVGYLFEELEVLGGDVPEVLAEAAGCVWDVLVFWYCVLWTRLLLNIGMIVMGIMMICLGLSVAVLLYQGDAVLENSQLRMQ